MLSVDDLGEDFSLEVQVDQLVGAERLLTFVETALHEMQRALEHAPDQAVTTLPLLPEAERHQLLVEWTNTEVDYPAHKCIHELFETQVISNPESVAVICGDSQLSYKELNQKSNQLAHYLIQERGVAPDTLVGICLDRSLEIIVGILAVLKAGGAYVPLDPEYPKERLEYIMGDAQLTTVLTQRHLHGATPVGDAQAVYLDDEKLQRKLQLLSPLAPEDTDLNPKNLAYVIYTSGSTGRPKGVLIEHRNTVALIDWAVRTFSKEQLSCVLASTSICFDLSVFEMFCPLASGGSLVIVQNIASLQYEKNTPKISLINTVPSAVEALLEADCIPDSVKTINLAGEPLKQTIVDQLYDENIDAVYDLYGPSEDTTYSTFVLRTPQGSASIGKPIDNCQVYLLNKNLQPVGQGIVGEIYIGGSGLARGYLNRNELTAEKFIANPFYKYGETRISERLYRTGDLARWLPNGNLEFIGRLDHQVKIRGFRVELGEIEQRLNEHVDVKSSVVVAKDAVGSNDKRLIAYVVPQERDEVRDDEDVSEVYCAARQAKIDSLREYVAESLPAYMVPSAFVLLAEVPLTPNGKIDRKALPEPEDSIRRNEYIAPRTETERVLCDMWQEVLKVDQVSVSDNFFDLGGHSLSAMKLVARVQTAFAVNIPLMTLFNGQSVSSLAEIIDRSAVVQKNKSMASQEILEEMEW